MIDFGERYLLKFCKKVFVACLILAIFSNTTFAAIWNVDTNSDADNNTCVANEADNDDDCSLRDAVTQLAAGDTIRFLENMTIADTSAGVTSHQITVDNATIDGQTNNVTVQIDGNNKGGGSAAAYFKVFGNNTTIKGLYIYNYTGNAIELMYHTATGANINNNVIGLKPDGTVDGNLIGIQADAANATIQNNVISGNGTGISINDTSDTDVTIKGNRIGVDGVLSNGVLQSSGGTTDKGNSVGIEIQGGDFTGDGIGDEGLIIGGTNAGDRNIIAGNSTHQIWNRGTNFTTGNITIQNNYIGVGSDGLTKLTSGDSSSSNPAGIKSDGASNSSTLNWTIKDNVISGMDRDNPLSGVFGEGVNIANGNSITLQGNKIGVGYDGTTSIGNEGHGVVLDATTITVGSNLDGSNDSSEGNIISNNGDNGGYFAGDGLQINGADTVTVNINGNKVGVNNTSASAPNSGDGIEINASAATTINIGGVGPTVSSDGTNIVGKNTLNGINVAITGGSGGSPATFNIRNNKIGYDGSANLANTLSGINYAASVGVANLTIGTDGNGTNDLAEKNIIGFNVTGGVNASRAEIYIASGVKSLVVAGNEVVGSSVGGQGSHGILLNVTDANLNMATIGGDDCANEANYITGIDGKPINVVDVGNSNPVTADMSIRCNRIGFTVGNVAGSNNINAVTDSAVYISEADRILLQDNVIGNAIGYGVSILGGNKLEVYGNKFGTTVDGLSPASIGQAALYIRTTTLAVADGVPIPVIIGGATAALGNVFAASTTQGININRLVSSTPVTIQGNYIGVCASQSGQGSISTGNLATCKNGAEGIRADYGAITIGGGSGNNIAVDGTLGAGNVISNNTSDGIYLINNVASATISGNIIGLIKSSSTANYDVAAGNGGDGITANSAALSSITIGENNDASSAGRNVISSNAGDGINITAALAGAGVAIYNNYIGIDWTGTLVRGNSSGDGVEVNSANVSSVNIGSATGRNVISANNVGLNLALVTASAVINIFNNYIGVSSAGTVDLGNTTYGVIFSENVNATINIGGTQTNQGNVISGNNQPNSGQSGIHLGTGGASVTNVLANKIGTNASGSSAIPNDSGIKIGENVTVNIGDGTSAGANVISGNTVYGIDVSYGSVNIRGNKIGVNAAGISELLNGSRAIEANASVSGNIPFLTIGQGVVGGFNTIAGAMRFTNIIPINEIGVVSGSVTDAGIDSDNTWIAGGNYSWQRYASGALVNSGPPVCVDKIDNDSDTFTDYLSDPGCTSVYDSDEYNAVASSGGGGGFVAPPAGGGGAGSSLSSVSDLTTPGSDSTDSSSSGSGLGPEVVVSSGVVSGAGSGVGSGSVSGSGVVSPSGTTETSDEASTIPVESVSKAASQIPLSRRQIERILDDSVSKVTDTVVREKRVNVEALLSLTEEREARKEESVIVQPERIYEQRVLDGFLLKKDVVTQTEKMVVEQVLEKIVSRELNQLLDGAGVSVDTNSGSSIDSGVDGSGTFGSDSSGSIASGVSTGINGGGISGGIADFGGASGVESGGFVVTEKRVLKIVDDDGEEIEIKPETRIEFELDAEKAKQKRKEVKSKGDDVLVLTTFSDPLSHGVSLTAELNEFGTIGDPLVNDKFAFGVESGKQYKSRQELVPEKLKVTNLKNDMTVGSKFVLWFGAQDIGKKYDVFAVNPETFAYTHLSEIEIDEGNRAASVIDLDKVSDDVKDGNKLAFLVIQDADGKVIDNLKVNIDPDLQFEGEEIRLSSSKMMDVVNLEDGSRESAFNWTDSLYSNAMLSSADIVERETGKDIVKENDRRVLSGYFEPGSMVFVTWKSLVYSSVVISDASQGYFEVEIPKQLAEGDHEVIVYAYKKNRNVVSQIRNLLFSKKKSS